MFRKNIYLSRRRPLLPFRWKDVPGAKIHIKKSKCKRFRVGVGFTAGFSAISEILGIKMAQKKERACLFILFPISYYFFSNYIGVLGL